MRPFEEGDLVRIVSIGSRPYNIITRGQDKYIGAIHKVKHKPYKVPNWYGNMYTLDTPLTDFVSSSLYSPEELELVFAKL